MIIIAAGSNKPFCGQAPREIVSKAMKSLSQFGSGQAVSPLYASPAWPDPKEPTYVNAVCTFSDSDLTAQQLLQALHGLEDGFGREREYLDNPALRYAPRTLDLDLIAYHDQISDEAGLNLPHQGLETRDFVLAPLCDLAPGWKHPISGIYAKELLASLEDVSASRLSA